jgi:large subunit ribosomal protein L18Ae
LFESSQIKQYVIVGRKKPTTLDPEPKIFKTKLFASNVVVAKSRFFYFLGNLKRVKRSNGEILSIQEVFEKNPNTVKNFAVLIKYDSRTGTHSMYKEYRDVTVNGAIEQMYAEMAGRHRARKSSIQIVAVNTITAKQCKRPATIQYLKSNIRFPRTVAIPRASSKQFRTTFVYQRPNVFAL